MKYSAFLLILFSISATASSFTSSGFSIDSLGNSAVVVTIGSGTSGVRKSVRKHYGCEWNCNRNDYRSGDDYNEYYRRYDPRRIPRNDELYDQYHHHRSEARR